MIRIDKDYFINVDANNYIPSVDLHRKKKDKKGNLVDDYIVIGYFNTLSEAVKGCLEYQAKKYLSENDMSLESAVRALHGISVRFESILEEAMKGL